jgi:hypothetical protein
LGYLGNSNVESWSTPSIEYFSGDGSTTTFKLTKVVNSFYDLWVVVENVLQHPDESYTWDYTTNSIIFYEAPQTGVNNIYLRFNSRQTTIIAPGQGTVTDASLSVGAPKWNPAGNLTVSGTMRVAANLTANNITSNNTIIAANVSATYFAGNGSQISNLNGANVTTGQITASRLGTGTTDSTTYLRGDGVWSTAVSSVKTTVGFTPSTTTTGAITISGTLATANGGTNLNSFTANGAVYATDTVTLTTGTLPVRAGGTGSTTLTANSVLIGNSTNAIKSVAPGTANNILVSDGTNWVSGSATSFGIGVSGGGGRGTIYTANGTFTVPLGISQVKVTVIGGGGGFMISPNLQYGANGGAGGTAIKYVTGLTTGQNVTVTVGTKGASANAYTGSATSGTPSSFGSYAVATGGGGAYYDIYGVANDGNPGLGTTGDFSVTGTRLNPINTSYYYGQGDIRGLTSSIPNGVVLVEY